MKIELMRVSTHEEPNVQHALISVKETLKETKHIVHRILLSVDSRIAYAQISDVQDVPRIMR